MSVHGPNPVIYHVEWVPEWNTWAVSVGGHYRSWGCRQQDALLNAPYFARQTVDYGGWAHVVVHRRDGSVQKTMVYGSPPDGEEK